METDAFIRELYAPEFKAREEITLERGRKLEKLRVAALNILNSDDGKLFLDAVLEHAGVFRTSFTGNSMTFFLEGRRFPHA